MDFNINRNYRHDVNFSVKGPLEICLHVEGLHELTKAIHKLGEKAMSLATEIKDLTASIDAATNEVAKDVADLKNRIVNSMSQAEVDSVKAGLTAIENRLKVLGSEDFSEPVDPVEPV